MSPEVSEPSFEREVLPHVPDAWFDTGKRDRKDGEVGLVGYEINFNRYFYQHTVKVDPDTVSLEEGFARDARKIGHYGTGDLEITLRNREDLEKAKSLFQASYEAS